MRKPRPWWETYPREYRTATDLAAAREAGVVPPLPEPHIDPALMLLAERTPKTAVIGGLYAARIARASGHAKPTLCSRPTGSGLVDDARRGGPTRRTSPALRPSSDISDVTKVKSCLLRVSQRSASQTRMGGGTVAADPTM